MTAPPTEGAIDVDVHVAPASIDALTPYMDDYWRDYLANAGLVLSPNVGGSYPPGAPRPPSDVGALREQVLDPWRLRHAVLTCLTAFDASRNGYYEAALCSAINDWLRAEWLELGAEKPFHLRIGINTGYCTVGNFGSDDRMDYTIIGSAVNLTARLQSHSEIDGVLLGHETYSLVRDDVAVDEQTPIKVKGFAEPVRCYKVLGLYDDLAAEGSVIREESDGFKVLLDLQKQDRAAAVAALEAIVARLKASGGGGA